ncbi:hypothetical protein GW915_06830 [bacterium]|nr:hypothetical protein [bacterium]
MMTKYKDQNFIGADGFSLAPELKTRFEERILSWIDSTQSVLFFSGKPKYSLEFKLDSQKQIQCRLKISFKFRKWCSEVLESNPVDAFEAALASLSLRSPLSQRIYRPGRVTGYRPDSSASDVA